MSRISNLKLYRCYGFMCFALVAMTSSCGPQKNLPTVLDLSGKTLDFNEFRSGPLAAAASVSFVDTASLGGLVSGKIKISRATDERSLSHYVVYWGVGEKNILEGSTPIATLSKVLPDLSIDLPTGTTIPKGATHILVKTKNPFGEMANGVSALVEDKGVPRNAAASLSFQDVNPRGGKLGGTVNITKATDESDLSQYVLYWGLDSSTKLSTTPISVLAKTGENLSYSLPENTLIPKEARYLLLFTSNKDGEMASGIGTLLDDLGLPLNSAVSISFTDEDPAEGTIAGQVSVTRAVNEDDLTEYGLYWGSNSSTKLNQVPFVMMTKTGANLVHTFPNGTKKPDGASHLLVFTKNADGEMLSGISAEIDDRSAPENSAEKVEFIDADLANGKISGPIKITKAMDESDISHYVLYWGSDEKTKLNKTPLATIEKTGSDVTHALAAGTEIPSMATHLLVFTKNISGEMTTGVGALIVDKGGPDKPALSISFNDLDDRAGKLMGQVNIKRAEDESKLSHYVLYWGKNATTKLNKTPIARIAKTGQDLSHTFMKETAKLKDTTHLLVFTSNNDAEMTSGPSVLIYDKGLPVNAASRVAFTDTDPQDGKIAGSVLISKAANEADVTHYVLYWGSSSSSKLNSTKIIEIPKSGKDLSHMFSMGTAKTKEATHLLVFTRNKDGEMAAGVNVAVVDKGRDWDVSDRLVSSGILGKTPEGETLSVVSDGGACLRVARNGSKFGSCMHKYQSFLGGRFIAAVVGADTQLWSKFGSVLQQGCHTIRCDRSAQANKYDCTCQVGATSSKFSITYSQAVPPTPVPTATPRPTVTPSPVPTVTPRPTITPTPVPTATPRPTITPTPVPTATPRPTVTPTPVPTATPRPTVTPTPVPTVSPTAAPVGKNASCHIETAQSVQCFDLFHPLAVENVGKNCANLGGVFSAAAGCKAAGKVKGCKQVDEATGTQIMTEWAYTQNDAGLFEFICPSKNKDGVRATLVNP